MINSPSLIVITAPSGAGKTTIIKRLLQKHHSFCFSISHTTRSIRCGEQEGREYYFIDKEKFEEKIKNNNFLEWAKVHNNYYGTSKQEIQRLQQQNKTVILDIDVQGALELMSRKMSKEDSFLKNALYIFISVDSKEILRKRLIQRATDDMRTIELRLKNAERELALQKNWQNIIVNREVNQSVEKIEKLIRA